ncbi:hypothetical protein ASF24_12945 [Methylobacterium sp. Leaf86]|uniref:HNH endonuclease n=1 Tax=Methylobacterium sp. Leaf86 TaxID=1736242 RepID=UPI0006FCF851|nr:HNH endonuclease [Methylobacterium sp. Leaf86]KQO59084.1 hypothetical protein ASF24_12945 [Methylobacterium sp. Leaf86]
MDAQIEAACRHYDERYDVVFERMWQRSEKHVLGDVSNRRCRFCGKAEPEVTFADVAHAVSEALGNRGLTSTYECDNCNGHFGRTVETHLGEWSKPMRTFARIRGKNGIPTLKKGPNNAWRVEYKNDRLEIKNYEDDPIFDIDDVNKKLIITLRRGAYIPVAVYKAFVKIGLTLMPEAEMSPFGPALEWIRETDHTKSWVRGATILHTFQNGPMPPDKLVAIVLRRKPGITDVPYAYLILGYGNDVFQVLLPAPAEDAHLNGVKQSVVPFPTPGGPDPATYGRAMAKPLDMTGTSPVKGETTKFQFGFDSMTKGPPPGSTSNTDAAAKGP